AVNAYINRVPYRADIDNYGVDDYWATPREFFARGGDCEDYAIAKYLSLRALGWPAERLRVAVIEDRARNLVHSVLIAYHEGRALVLDIEIETVTDQRRIDRYAPIFAIAENGWWSYRSERRTGSGERIGAATEHEAERTADADPVPGKKAVRAGRPVSAKPVVAKPVVAKPVVARSLRAESRKGKPQKTAATHRAKPAPRQATLRQRPISPPNEAQSVQIDPAPPPAPGERMEQVFLPGAR
ncbi:MAG: transglutaminase-like cysteine peptidase, partial [Rhodospirillaceae bacterium]|nr:transglutaminase-like cysteine peptidase [Rhodospirillaceae bacterium]